MTRYKNSETGPAGGMFHFPRSSGPDEDSCLTAGPEFFGYAIGKAQGIGKLESGLVGSSFDFIPVGCSSIGETLSIFSSHISKKIPAWYRSDLIFGVYYHEAFGISGLLF